MTDQAKEIYDLGVMIGQPATQQAIYRQDAYQWHVAYVDGTSTSEYDDARPDGRGWAERDAKPVRAITLTRRGQAVEAANIPVPDGATPVFFRRRRRSINLQVGTQTSLPAAHCIGWKRDSDAVYLFVFDDGSTLLTDDLQAV